MKALSDSSEALVRGRLWPVAALLVVALVAVPVLLADREELPPVPAPAPSQVQTLQAAIVSAAGTDLGERRRVLGARKDPFAPSGRQPRAAAATSDDAPSAAASTPATATSDFPTTGGASASAGGSSSGGSSAPTSTGGGSPSPPPYSPTPITPAPTPVPIAPVTPTKPKAPEAFSLVVRLDGGERQVLRRLDPLPDADAPVAVYLGVLADGRAVFLLDDGVEADGDGSCHPNPSDCQRVYLAEGDTEFFSRGGEGEAQELQLDLVKIRAKRAKASASAGARTALAGTGERRLAGQWRRKAGRLRLDRRSGRLEALDGRGWYDALTRAARGW